MKSAQPHHLTLFLPDDEDIVKDPERHHKPHESEIWSVRFVQRLRFLSSQSNWLLIGLRSVQQIEFGIHFALET